MGTLRRSRAAALVAALVSGCLGARGDGEPLREARANERAAVEAVLDDFHAAASAADLERMLGYLAPGAVFVGTDASEHWEREAFRAYAAPYFAQGRGWTFLPQERHVWVRGGTAWFDERLANAKYGATRGSGVLVRDGRTWRLAQYVLSFPIPNELAERVVALVRSGAEGGADVP